jgi:hypothetical protein
MYFGVAFHQPTSMSRQPVAAAREKSPQISKRGKIKESAAKDDAEGRLATTHKPVLLRMRGSNRSERREAGRKQEAFCHCERSEAISRFCDELREIRGRGYSCRVVCGQSRGAASLRSSQ